MYCKDKTMTKHSLCQNSSKKLQKNSKQQQKPDIEEIVPNLGELSDDEDDEL